ncbi:MAG: S-layer homology domain-containing protein [Leptolyngbyaceae bacterium]|nr:S-layer homology domain-containing protein [Leptolyngbyaceae bacterium]
MLSVPRLLSLASTTLLTLGLGVGAIAPLMVPVSVIAAPNPATTFFPDIQNHWAQPFIQALAERNIVAGYPDGTYRPNRAMERDEFAAILRQAFDQSRERSIPSGSVYQDVPENYWAEAAIEEAYEAGFMEADPKGYFRPRQPISRVEILETLAQNLDLPDVATASQQATTSQPQTPQAAARRTLQPLMFPLAMTVLMQPIMGAPALAAQLGAPAPTPRAQAQPPVPASVAISNYYVDADQIPQQATKDVLAATRAGIVVNHPNPQVLNPSRPATRAETAAFIHQALVSQDRLAPIPQDAAAANYIVGDRKTGL